MTITFWAKRDHHYKATTGNRVDLAANIQLCQTAILPHAEPEERQRSTKLIRKPFLDMSSPLFAKHDQEDFIKGNALDVIHQQSQKPPIKEQQRSTDKPDYGKIPLYLKAAKMKLQQDRAAKEEEERIKAQQVRLLRMYHLQSIVKYQCVGSDGTQNGKPVPARV